MTNLQVSKKMKIASAAHLSKYLKVKGSKNGGPLNGKADACVLKQGDAKAAQKRMGCQMRLKRT